MAELDPDIKRRVEALINEAMGAFQAHDIGPSIGALTRAWEPLPAPEEAWSESFLIAKYMTHTYFNAHQLDQAHTWATIFNRCHVIRSYGESELLLGKVLFEKAQLEEARGWFAKADALSKGRVWKGEKETKYKTFFKSK